MQLKLKNYFNNDVKLYEISHNTLAKTRASTLWVKNRPTAIDVTSPG